MDLKKQLLGEIEKNQATGNHEPDDISLRKSLKDPDAFIRTFCTGCGEYIEITKRGAEIEAQNHQFDLPTNPSQYYLEVTRCLACDSDFAGTVLKRIE